MKLTMKEHGARIRKGLEAGTSYRALAEELGCSKDTVAKFARQHYPALRRKTTHEERVERDNRPMRILLVDIETRPNLAHVWDIWNQNIGIGQLVESVEMMCFAAKWLDDPLVRFFSAHADGHGDMVNEAWKLLDLADVVMHYNGRRFDVPHLQREFIGRGLPPTSPFKQIDLLATVKRQFRFPSNKLAYVSEALGLEGKTEHEGFGLWLKCMDGDPDAWARMQEYNIRDVQLLEELYYALLPWIERHPSYGAMTGEDVCPNCGGKDLAMAGYAHTRTGKYDQWRCIACGKHSRGTKRVDHTGITEVAS